MRNKCTPKRGGNTGRNASNRSTPKKDNKPDKSKFVEDEDRRNKRRIFREEWEAMRASGCIGEDEGNYYRLNHFDYVPPRDED